MSTATFPLNKQEVATLRDALELYWGSLDPPSDDELPNADALEALAREATLLARLLRSLEARAWPLDDEARALLSRLARQAHEEVAAEQREGVAPDDLARWRDHEARVRAVCQAVAEAGPSSQLPHSTPSERT
jgi:hypothetical protein